MANKIDFMISTTQLNNLLQAKAKVVVIDVRSVDEYNNGHIYTSINIPEIFTYLPEGLTTQREKKDFVDFYENIFSKAGLSDGKVVVFYEDKFTLKSPRGLSILKYLGFDEENIKVLDGGYERWYQSNFKTTQETIHNKTTKFIADVDESFFVDYNEMLEIIYNEKIITLDVRDKDEWIGISSSPYGIDFAPKKGRLPNAVWIEWYDFITHDMMSVESLQKIKIELGKKNINIKDEIVLYCFKGARLSNTYIALRKLGYENIRIYFAGWNEWCRKDGAPIINEVENDDNPILQENIALKTKLDRINLKDATLIDFPKYNKEPIFSFDREGKIFYENKPKQKKLSSIKKFTDIFPNAMKVDIHNIIDNFEQRSITVIENEKYFLLNCVGSREANNILVYAFETTELNLLNKNLEDQFNLVHKIIDTVPVRIFWKSKDGIYLGANKLFLGDAKLNSEKDIIGKTDFDMPWGESEAQLYRDDDISVMESAIPRLHFEETQTDDNGNVITLLTSKVPLIDANGSILGVLGSYADITKQRNIENELRKQKNILHFQATHDELTGLANRILFNDRLTSSINKAKRNNSSVAIFFIDLDHFKEINDSLGHEAGDVVLKEVTSRFNEVVRNEDSVARIGGDEFTVILEDLLQAQDASLVAKKILKALSEPIFIGENEVYISSSIGISIYPDDGILVQDLLKYADSAMYKAKDEGRNNFQFYSSEMTELAFERVVMETSLRAALSNEEFVVYYQPQVNGINNELVGMEALVRWQHPTMGLVSPAKFIPLAESTGLIVELDRYVMKTAMTQIAQWYKDGFTPGILAMNLAVKQLQQEDFIPMFKQLMKETNCKSEWLALEVTEGQIMTHPEKAIVILQAISDLGVELAVDDFGTGYSSLAYLKRLPIDKLKIDQAFVRDLPGDEEDVGITKAVIALAKSLNMKVIAEGVETKEQRDFIVENGCENIQGYFYSKPVPADELKGILRDGF